MSTFAYLREKRMEHAIDLLRSGNSNVTETAFAVGYNNVSHFSELFRKKVWNESIKTFTYLLT